MRDLTERELALSAPHLCYEIEQMAYGAARLVPNNDPMMQSAGLEAFLVHVRVLNDFVGRPKRNLVDDVIAASYFGPGEWTQAYALPDETKDEIHKRIAHLTTHRINDPDAWDRAELSGLVFKRLGQFVGELEALHPMRAAWIKPRYRNAKAHFEQTKRTGWMPH